MNCFLSFLALFFFATNIQASPVPIGSGGLDAAGFTVHATLCGGITDTSPVQAVGPGSTGQLLISNGAGALPSYIDNPGSFVYLGTAIVGASDTLVINNSILTSTYNNYLCVYNFSSSANSTINLFFSTDNGVTKILTNYLSSFISHAYNSATFSSIGSTGIGIGKITGGETIAGYFIIQGLHQTASTGPYLFGQVSNNKGSFNGFICGINTGSNNVNSLITIISGGVGSSFVYVFGIVS